MQSNGTQLELSAIAKVFHTAEVETHALHESGAMYDQYYHWVLRFRDGLIVESKEYLDTALVIDVLCGGGQVTPASPETTPSEDAATAS